MYIYICTINEGCTRTIYIARHELCPFVTMSDVSAVKDAWTGLQVGYHYKVIGTTYTATCDNKPNSKPCGSNARRRSLLQDEYGNSGERL